MAKSLGIFKKMQKKRKHLTLERKQRKDVIGPVDVEQVKNVWTSEGIPLKKRVKNGQPLHVQTL